MKNKALQQPKFQVKWTNRDNKGNYETFIFTQTKDRAEILLKNAVKNGAFQGQIIEYNK
jgi:hypothetical protein